MTLVDRVRRDLKKLPDDLAESALAGTALTMAEKIETGKGSPSECGKVLLQALQELRVLAPPKKEKDGIDQLAERRERRIAGRGAATADQQPS